MPLCEGENGESLDIRVKTRPISTNNAAVSVKINIELIHLESGKRLIKEKEDRGNKAFVFDLLDGQESLFLRSGNVQIYGRVGVELMEHPGRQCMQ